MIDEPKRILLVDDVRVFLELECMFLQRKGFQILTAMTGEDAIAKARAHKPHVVLLDYILPDMAGDECCRRIKSDPDLKHVVVIMVTTTADARDRSRCIEAGCDDYLTKPIKQVEFMDRIRKALDLKIRVTDRLSISAPVRFKVGNGPELRGVTMNVSPTGMFIVTQKPLDQGTKLSMTFTLPQCPLTFKATGEVIWNTAALLKGVITPGFGLRFTDIDRESFATLSRYVLDRLT